MKISVIFGTRPEAIKLCPLVLELRKSSKFIINVCVTGQHREMLDQVLDVFGIVPDTDLNLMKKNQSLASLTSRAITAINDYLDCTKPDLVLIQGDTTTVLCAALASYYNKIPIGHVEAGLRTGKKFSPFPEEGNRKLATHIADYHFAPTNLSRDNLLKEGIPDDRIFVTGNPVIDALYIAVEKNKLNPPEISELPKDFMSRSNDRKLVLITGHRRENFGKGFESICMAVATLAKQHTDVKFVYPVHLNPNVHEPVFRLMSGYPNITFDRTARLFTLCRAYAALLNCAYRFGGHTGRSAQSWQASSGNA